MLQRTLSAFVLVLYAVVDLLAGPAAATGKYAALVIDANTGAVLHAEAADEPRHPASLAKIMTLYLIFEQIERGRLAPSTKIKISPEAAAAPPTKMRLEAGTEVALIDAIKGLITKSANDAAIAVAEHIAGSEARFAALMTERARQLGMHNTVFRNASGLPDPEQVTTARDMLTLALRLQDDFPKHYPLFGMRSFAWGSKTYRNHNTLLGKFEGIDGIKTGYIYASGYNVVASVRRGSKHLVGAVFGGTTASLRDSRVRLLFTRALSRASAIKTRSPQRLVAPQAEARPRPAAPRRPDNGATAPISVPSPVPAVRPVRPARESPAESAVVASQPTIAIAKVRPVTLAPRLAQPAPATEAIDIPSMLEQQAETLSRQAPALDAPAMAPTPPRSTQVDRAVIAKAASAPVAAVAAVGGFELQVGAFTSSGEAERAVLAARVTALGLLDAHGSRTLPVMREKRQFFRARFTGFDAETGARTCAELKKLQLACLVVKAE